MTIQNTQWIMSSLYSLKVFPYTNNIDKFDGIYIRICENIKMIYLTLIAKNDKRRIISISLQFICETANTTESEVINGYKSYNI